MVRRSCSIPPASDLRFDSDAGFASSKDRLKDMVGGTVRGAVSIGYEPVPKYPTQEHSQRPGGSAGRMRTDSYAKPADYRVRPVHPRSLLDVSRTDVVLP